jgi:hypothetical protein
MIDYIVKDPPAKSLILGIRAIGYSFSTAIADIIDNSISAGATQIDIYSEADNENSFFAFLDNGCGMNSQELENAMLLGSDREDKSDSALELGRFGLGLKSASFSQCRQFIVVSKKYGRINAMTFDLDVVEKTNQWLIGKLNDEAIASLPLVSKLNEYKTGTLVIWKKFDKMEGLAKNFDDTFRASVAEGKKHVEFVFHRFTNKIRFRFNEKEMEKRDPFLIDSIGRQQTGRTTSIKVEGKSILITPYTLPFANSLTTSEKALLGNPKSIYDDQGFYLYRNERLISWGSWLRMGIKSELNKLARVKVDIPSSLDDIWMIDVKKSSAKIPDKIKDQIKASVEDSVIRSKRTVKYPGVKEQTIDNKIWERINLHEGNVKYTINRENPLLTTLFDVLGNNETQILETFLSQLECYIPKYSMQNDVSDAINILNSGDDIEENKLIDEVVQVVSMIPDDNKEITLTNLLHMESYKKILSKKSELIRRVFNND